jgi:hypothetical protein
MSGKGTGEYRKGQTPSDIASRSGSPEEGMGSRSDGMNALGFENQDPMTALAGEAYVGNGKAAPDQEVMARSDVTAAGASYTDQAQTLAMAAHVLNGYHPE